MDDSPVKSALSQVFPGTLPVANVERIASIGLTKAYDRNTLECARDVHLPSSFHF